MLLALFWAGARAMGRTFASLLSIFLIVWAIIAAVNGTIGVVSAGYSVLDEVLVFLPVFGVPALAAWLLAKRA